MPASTRGHLAAALAVALGLGPAAGLAQEGGQGSGAVAALLRQAAFWQEQSRFDMALGGYERVLAVEPDNAAALAGAARAAAGLGNAQRAGGYLARLRQRDPADARIAEIEAALRASRIDPGALAEARRLGREGRAAEAIARYRTLFGAEGPPPESAIEYYQTLAGTPAGYEEARTRLTALAARSPNDARLQLALAEVLTYRAGNRAEGIERLRGLADRPELAEAATRAWRQAVLWQGTNPVARPAVEAFLARFPEDEAMRRRLAELREARPAITQGDQARIRGFEELNGNRLREAERGFADALAVKPEDADALAGLGVVRLREGRAAEAKTLIERALAIAPEQRPHWGAALDGAGYAVGLQEGRAALARNDLDAAETLLREAVAREVPDRADAEALLGEVLLRRGDATAAETRFRAALTRRPDFGAAMAGLQRALRAQGRVAEADRLRPPGGPASPGAARAASLRASAERTTDLAARAALLRQALEAEPGNPWVRLDLARVLTRQGEAAAARSLVEERLAGRADADSLHAAALLAEEQGRNGDVVALLGRVPAGQRPAAMNALLARARTVDEVQQVAGSAGALRSPEIRQRLLAMASRRDPSGATAAAVIRAFGATGNANGAAEAARLALAVNADASPTARLAIAGALLAAGNSAEAETQARLLGADPRLTAEQRRELATLRAGSAIRTADRLNEEGQQAQAYDQLAPLLAADPENPSIRLALARLHNGARQPEEARRIAEAVLARDPRNLEARMTAADAAILAGDRARAESLLEEALALHPMDARVKLMEARIARASGNGRRAMRALREAQELRRIQLGQMRPEGAGETAGLAAPNPFLRQVSFGSSATAPSSAGLGAPPLRDQVSLDIARELASVQEEGASRLQGGVALRSRSGTAGLDRLQEFSAPLEASIRSETLNGRIVARATPVTVSTGSLSADADSLRRFGSNALNPGAAARPREDASGVGLGLAYQRPNFTLDAGTTPLGFLKENMLGGVEFAPLLNDSLRLRVTGERRAVTDSLLSWGGQRDPLSGRSWGGVTRTGGRAQLEYTTGPVTLYGGGGWASFDGSGVADNSRVEAGAGFSYAVLRKPGEELTSGLDLVYFGYDKNLRYFTLGQGGYFSPQSFTAVNIPVDYRARWGDLDYRVGGSLGYTNWHESNAPLFPNDRGLQRSLEAQAAGDPTLSTHYNGQTRNGVIGGVRLDGSYPLTDSLQIGGTLRYDRAANWNETRAMVYLRQRLGP